MEEVSKPSSMISISISGDKNMAPDDQNGFPLLKKRKRSAAMHLLKALLYMLRLKSRKSKSKSIQDNVVSNFSWKGLLGSMRPMHLQSDRSPPPPFKVKPALIVPVPEFIPVGEQTEEAITRPLSPTANVSPLSPAFSISSYGSATDLSLYGSPRNQEIHGIKPCEEITEEECRYNDDAGDENIDAKAEEFIAQFYQQIRLQNLNCS
ncbi:hypothetical protein DITRI_Ditri11bG0114700 [Diplodiscus trichospermus]